MIVEVATGVASFSWRVAVPTASSVVAPPVRLESTRLKRSDSSASESLIRATLTVLTVSPAAKARLPVCAT
ncbi:hypothetical protein D9M70_573110 [compost metagenome]